MVFCWCGKQARLRTYWTSRNPGRRFYCFPEKGSNCKFVGWHDPEMCQRSLEIILGLLRSKNELEVEKNKLQAKVKTIEDGARQMKNYLIFSGSKISQVFWKKTIDGDDRIELRVLKIKWDAKLL
ncbi:hypothetical protein R6Q57_009307 [Mikania cordata]